MSHYYEPTTYTAPRGQYRDYYRKTQYGNGALPAYRGGPRQKGSSLGSFLGGLFKSAVPLLSTMGKSVAKTAGKALLSTGTDVLSDVLSGKNIGRSIKNRSKATGQQLLKRAATTAQGYLSTAVGPPPAKRRATTKQTGRAGKKRKNKSEKNKKHLF